MFKVKGLLGLKKIRWQELEPGMVFVGGVRINDAVPRELADFPVMTEALLEDLMSRFYFLKNREILVANSSPGINTESISRQIRSDAKRLEKVNAFRDEFFSTKRRILEALGLPADLEIPIIEGDRVEREVLIKDRVNSFDVSFLSDGSRGPLPSFLGFSGLRPTLSDLLTNRLASKFHFPDDKDVLLHLVVDYSYSMNERDKFEIVIGALNYFCRYLMEFLVNTKIRIYVFSDECRIADFPLSGKEIPRKETNYDSFIKKVLHHKNPEINNKVILFTDGQPSDRDAALKYAALLAKNRIDYTQIVFSMAEDLRYRAVLPEGMPGSYKVIDNRIADSGDIPTIALTDEELAVEKAKVFADFTRLAETAGGNQICLKIDELAGLLSVECYDRYLGLLTLATRGETEKIANAGAGEAEREMRSGAEIVGGKLVKKWDFRKS